VALLSFTFYGLRSLATTIEGSGYTESYTAKQTKVYTQSELWAQSERKLLERLRSTLLLSPQRQRKGGRVRTRRFEKGIKAQTTAANMDFERVAWPDLKAIA
jgi:hypothetical protein